jgi:hypothetical protein
MNAARFGRRARRLAIFAMLTAAACGESLDRYSEVKRPPHSRDSCLAPPHGRAR